MARIVEVTFQKVAVPIEKLTLELSEDEALFLRDILARVGGSIKTRRAMANSIIQPLKEQFGDLYNTRDLHGSVEVVE